MAKIPQEFIDDLLSRTDIVEQITSHVPLRKMGKNFTACCPFHNEKTPSFVVFPITQVYHCFGCGAHGSAIRFLMDYERLNFIDAVQYLASQAGLTVPSRGVNFTDHHENLFKVLSFATNFYRNNLIKNAGAQNYLTKRHICSEIIERYQLGFALDEWRGLSNVMITKSADKVKMREALDKVGLYIIKDQNTAYDRFRNRLMFPIHDNKGRIIGFGGRVLDDSKPKYLNSPETVLFHKGNELYGLYQVIKKLRDIERIIVVEGYMDVISLAQHGVDNSVAVLGTSISNHHLQRLFRLTSEIVFCFDADNAGENAAKRALMTSLPLMSDGRSVKFLFLPKDHDPDSYIVQHGREEFLQAVLKAVPLAQYLFDGIAKKIKIDDIASRAKFVDLALPLILKIPAGIYKDMLISELSNRARVSEKAIREKISGDGVIEENIVEKNIPKSNKTKATTRLDLLDRASSILLQNPQMVSCIKDQFIENSKILPDSEVFREIYATIKSNPSVTTSFLADYWHGKDNFSAISNLMSIDLHVSGDRLELEFLGLLNRLEEKQAKILRKIELTNLAGSFTELSPEKKNKIRDILLTSK